MKIFAIRENNINENIGYLFYYEKSKECYIELMDNLNEWNVPLILSSLYKNGFRTINSYWTKVWISQRIVPKDRQNIGQILKDNKLKYYDEFELLLLSKGRCEQDDYYLEEINKDDLPKKILDRFEIKIEDILVLKDNKLLLFFKNKKVKLFDLKEYVLEHKEFEIVNKYIKEVQILVGGYGIYWDSNLEIMDYVLYDLGKAINPTKDIFIDYIKNSVLTTAEVVELLNCSRQYVNELVKNDKLHPIKSSEKNTLFLKSEVIKLNWI